MSESKISNINNQTKNSLITLPPWESITGFIGIVSGTSLFLSILFDMGYFETIGIQISDIPTTISDHVRSSLFWVPPVATMVLACALFKIILENFYNKFKEEEPTFFNNENSIAKKLSQWIYRLFIIGAFIIVCAEPLTGDLLNRYATIAQTVVVSYIAFVTAESLIKKGKLSTSKFIILIIFPAIAVLVYNLGRGKAIEDRETPRLAKITINEQREVEINIYRYLDRGILGTIGEGNLSYYRWEEIKKITSNVRTPRHINWLCRSFNINCVNSKEKNQ